MHWETTKCFQMTYLKNVSTLNQPTKNLSSYKNCSCLRKAAAIKWFTVSTTLKLARGSLTDPPRWYLYKRAIISKELSHENKPIVSKNYLKLSEFLDFSYFSKDSVTLCSVKHEHKKDIKYNYFEVW